MSDNNFVHCSLERHGERILEIFNDAIVNSTALYDYKPRTAASMVTWFEAKAAGKFPVIGIEDERGTLLGFASFGAFRPHPAYKYTVEHSVYVHAEHRGQGLGTVLLKRIVEEAEAFGAHAVIGAIDAENEPSLRLHQSLGFERVGTLPQVGFKFGRWLDLAFVQLILATPANPEDDN
jgi:phosphinothricin acetyltransferase